MHPVLFYLGSVPIYSYQFFSAMAMLTGAIMYFRLIRAEGISLESSVMLWAGAITGGFIGSVFAAVLLSLHLAPASLTSVAHPVVERTVVGGITGGWLGVYLAKKMVGIRQQTGDPFALAIALAVGIGRIGCFLGGCCYGRPAQAWYAVYMAGQYRYPTQLLEMACDFGLFGALWVLRGRMKNPGDLFKLFVLAYAVVRFFLDFIRDEPVIWHSLTLCQMVAIPVVVWAIAYFAKTYSLGEGGHGIGEQAREE